LEVPAPNEDNVIEIEQNHLSIEFNKIHLDSDKNFLLKTAKLVQFSSIGRDLINEKLVIDEIEGHYIDLLNSKNDAWEEAFGNSANTFPESVNLIRTALNNKEFLSDISRFDAEKQLWTTIAVWIQERDRLFSEWQTAKIGSKKRERLKKEYENTLLVLTQGNTYFSDFANRYLVGDSMADIRELLQTEEVA
jgi:hypothetical protein